MIRLNLSTDYALRLLLYLASSPGRQASTREVAGFYQISSDHLSKVAQHLAHAGYVRAGRGRTGGLRLGKPAEQISVGDVVELFEGPVALLECVNTEHVCVIQPHCRLRSVLQRAGAQLVREMKQVTLADLVGVPADGGLVQLSARTVEAE
jgi:Rrf2 family nitric oxide-sensitive transcriptional repressor